MPFEIYSTDTDAGTVTVTNANNGVYNVVATIDVGNAPRGAVKFTGNNRAFVSNCGGNSISEIDVLTHQEIRRIPVGCSPRGIGVIPGNNYLLVSNSGDDSLSIVSLITNSEIGKIPVAKDPRHMAITADGHWAYVCLWRTHRVAKINTRALAENRIPDIATETVVSAEINLLPDSFPYSNGIDSVRNMLYVACTQSPLLQIINLATDTLLPAVNLGRKGARAVVFSPDGTRAYVNVEASAEIVVLNTANRAIINRISAGEAPRGIAIDPSGATLFSADFSRIDRNLAMASPTPGVRVVDVAAGLGVTKTIPTGLGTCSVSVRSLS